MNEINQTNEKNEMNRVSGVRISGCGNRFLLVPGQMGMGDDSKILELFRSLPESLDGILLLQPGPSLRYFNRNGSEAKVCGNGLRCAAYWLYMHSGRVASISTPTGEYRVEVKENEAGVELPISPGLRTSRLIVEHRPITVRRVEVGVPHGVVWVDYIDRVDVETLGRAIRSHHRFKPEGINVDFVQLTDSDLLVRSYERGVERETLSCATGAAAAALVGYLSQGLMPPIRCKFPGGELVVNFEPTAEGIRAAWVWGGVSVDD
jgi:diaminopimelate epimerase